MPTTRRSNGPARNQPAKMPSISEKPTTSQLHVPPATHSAYLPTRTELLLLALYPITLVLGSLFSNISPLFNSSATTAVYSTVHQSYQPPSAAPSYFAQKTNIFNVYFVKIGWLWCTTALFMFTTFVARGRLAGLANPISAPDTTPSSSSSPSAPGGSPAAQREAQPQLRRQVQVALRYGLATLVWIITTQWFFGPPLVDRGFALTGGACDVASSRLDELRAVQAAGGDDLVAKEKEELAKALTHAACKVAGGAWKGGWDISGHVFILVLGSGMLWMEMLPFLVPRVKGLGLGRVIRTGEGVERRVGHEIARLGLVAATDVLEEEDGQSDTSSAAWTLRAYATTLALGVVVLSWWMLLMTSAFFHTWFEKLTGLLWALFGVWTIYFLPRGQMGFRSIIGMPGF